MPANIRSHKIRGTNSSLCFWINDVSISPEFSIKPLPRPGLIPYPQPLSRALRRTEGVKGEGRGLVRGEKLSVRVATIGFYTGQFVLEGHRKRLEADKPAPLAGVWLFQDETPDPGLGLLTAKFPTTQNIHRIHWRLQADRHDDLLEYHPANNRILPGERYSNVKKTPKNIGEFLAFIQRPGCRIVLSQNCCLIRNLFENGGKS
jgi:hypothetical protein